MMEHKIRETGNNVKVVNLIGKLDTGTSAKAEKILLGLVQAGTVKILVNFEKLDYISSSGLRVLLMTAKKLGPINGELRLCHLNEVIEEIFEISGFSSILNVYQSEELGLKDF